MIDNNITKDHIRILAVFKQGLHERPDNVNKDTLLEIVHNVQLLQLDAINVVARSVSN